MVAELQVEIVFSCNYWAKDFVIPVFPLLNYLFPQTVRLMIVVYELLISKIPFDNSSRSTPSICDGAKVIK